MNNINKCSFCDKPLLDNKKMPDKCATKLREALKVKRKGEKEPFNNPFREFFMDEVYK
jgi:hypothetical protein